MLKYCYLALFMAVFMCTCVSEKDPELFGITDQFIGAVNEVQPDVAFDLLSKDAKETLGYETFAKSCDSFDRIADVFLNSGIRTRSQVEISIQVSSTHGEDYLFVLVLEGGQYKIANIVKQPSP